MKAFATIFGIVTLIILTIAVYASWETGRQIGFKAGQMEAETYYTQAFQLQAQGYEAQLVDEIAKKESIRTALHESLNRELLKEAEATTLSEELAIMTRDLEEARTYNGLVQFDSKLDLMHWLYDNPVSDHEYVDRYYVCSDFALDLCIDAWNDGYIMGLSRISNERHQRAFTIIGKTIYEIEAITDGVKEVGSVY